MYIWYFVINIQFRTVSIRYILLVLLSIIFVNLMVFQWIANDWVIPSTFYAIHTSTSLNDSGNNWFDTFIGMAYYVQLHMYNYCKIYVIHINAE